MTGLTKDQINFLLAPIDTWRIGQANGRPNMMAYDIRAHLNRVFGFGNWDGEATHMELVSENFHQNKNGKDAVTVVYRCRYTLRVRSIDGTPLATYTEWAVGSAKSYPVYILDEAHDFSAKSAESQALKRCAINLGDQFGLSLYGNGRTDALVQITYGHPGELAADPTAVDETPVAPEVDPDTGEVAATAQAGEESQEPAPWDVDMSSLSVEQLRGLWGDAISNGHEAFADFAVKCFTNGAPENILQAVPKQMAAMNEKAEANELKPVHLDFDALRHVARR